MPRASYLAYQSATERGYQNRAAQVKQDIMMALTTGIKFKESQARMEQAERGMTQEAALARERMGLTERLAGKRQTFETEQAGARQAHEIDIEGVRATREEKRTTAERKWGVAMAGVRAGIADPYGAGKVGIDPTTGLPTFTPPAFPEGVDEKEFRGKRFARRHGLQTKREKEVLGGELERKFREGLRTSVNAFLVSSADPKDNETRLSALESQLQQASRQAAASGGRSIEDLQSHFAATILPHLVASYEAMRDEAESGTVFYPDDAELDRKAVAFKKRAEAMIKKYLGVFYNLRYGQTR